MQNRMKPTLREDRLQLVKVPSGYGKIELSMFGNEYVITEDFDGFIKIHRKDGESLLLSPGVRNEVLFK